MKKGAKTPIIGPCNAIECFDLGGTHKCFAGARPPHVIPTSANKSFLGPIEARHPVTIVVTVIASGTLVSSF